MGLDQGSESRRPRAVSRARPRPAGDLAEAVGRAGCPWAPAAGAMGPERSAGTGTIGELSLGP
jgi:transposase